MGKQRKAVETVIVSMRLPRNLVREVDRSVKPNGVLRARGLKSRTAAAELGLRNLMASVEA